ncbi:19970_t:CDS:2 [Rhizophagus irregularis]|nr:19970_t:CDS:2 [Rhizophagus irregularis]
MSKDRDLTSLRQELDNVQNLNASLHEQLEHTHKENLSLTDDNTFLRKKILSHQHEINNSHNECVRLESELYQQVQEIERLRKENVGFLKNKREVERKLREETQAFEKDRVVWQERESELIDQIKALQDTVSVLAQQNEQVSERRDEENSYYAAARELKNVQRSIKELERRNNELATELEKAKQATNESVNISKNHVRRIQQLENELSQVKHMNQSLMEENESFQRLIFEKTMKGEFMFNPIMQLNDSHKHADVIKKITNGISGNALEAELTRADELTSSLLGERVHKESDHTIIDKFQEEIKSLNDANKDMRLYIEKILHRILDVQGFEEILSFEWKKPSVSSPVSPTTGSFEEKKTTKKVERRKTFSGWHFRSTSQPQNTYKSDKIPEEPDTPLPLPTRKSNDDTLHPPSVIQKRPLRRNSTSAKNTNRLSSFFGWGGGVKEEEKKEDPFMRPMILLQEQERKD